MKFINKNKKFIFFKNELDVEKIFFPCEGIMSDQQCLATWYEKGSELKRIIWWTSREHMNVDSGTLKKQ